VVIISQPFTDRHQFLDGISVRLFGRRLFFGAAPVRALFSHLMSDLPERLANKLRVGQALNIATYQKRGLQWAKFLGWRPNECRNEQDNSPRE
jgi:hypothetical protein